MEFNTTTWSRHSARMLRRNLSTMGLQFGDFGGIFTMSMPTPSATVSNLSPNLQSLSRMRYFGPSPNGVASLVVRDLDRKAISDSRSFTLQIEYLQQPVTAFQIPGVNCD